MIFGDFSNAKVFLYLGRVDFRKSINGLSAIVVSELKLEPMGGDLYIFCGRRKNTIKILYWDKNGYCLWQKRLEVNKFKWPRDEKEVMQITSEELGWLLRGLDFRTAHKVLSYSSMV